MSASEGTTTFAMGSSDMHRVPSKPFAPAQGIKSLEGARSITALPRGLCEERAVAELRPRAHGHAGGRSHPLKLEYV